jgi:hypothetical protein
LQQIARAGKAARELQQTRLAMKKPAPANRAGAGFFMAGK